MGKELEQIKERLARLEERIFGISYNDAETYLLWCRACQRYFPADEAASEPRCPHCGGDDVCW